MIKNTSVKNLVKILIGAVWLDGKIQPEEWQYLQQVAKQKGLTDDLELQLLLYEFRTVQPAECYEWVREYLGDDPSTEDYRKLIRAISDLIASDHEVALEEAQLLTKLQPLNPEHWSTQTVHSAVLKEIQKLYRRVVLNTV